MKNKNKGQTIIEVIVVAGISVMMLAAMISTVVIAAKKNRVAKDKSVATKLAQEGMEWIRGEREKANGWGNFYTTILTGKTYCLPNSSVSLGTAAFVADHESCSILIDNYFRRTVKVTESTIPPNPQTYTIISKVTWPGEVNGIESTTTLSERQ